MKQPSFKSTGSHPSQPAGKPREGKIWAWDGLFGLFFLVSLVLGFSLGFPGYVPRVVFGFCELLVILFEAFMTKIGLVKEFFFFFFLRFFSAIHETKTAMPEWLS